LKVRGDFMLNEKQEKKETRPFGVRDQFAYFCGDVGGSFVNVFVDSYFLVFCTYVLGISAFYMGTLFLVARVWDAFCDPLLGSLTDKYVIGKSGDRFKPYVKLFMLPLILAGVICFIDVSSWTMVWKCIWISVAYILVEMSYTGTSMPYGSLVSVISNDFVDRGKLSHARAFGGG
jgi:GPH family glycoside/pentoside/hexuronide:cation symporter